MLITGLFETIDSFIEEAIHEIYAGGYTYQSSNVIYGILTEEYSITYEKDIHGNVVIDSENLQKLNQLLADTEAVEKSSQIKRQHLLSEKLHNSSKTTILIV